MLHKESKAVHAVRSGHSADVLGYKVIDLGTKESLGYVKEVRWVCDMVCGTTTLLALMWTNLCVFHY